MQTTCPPVAGWHEIKGKYLGGRFPKVAQFIIIRKIKDDGTGETACVGAATAADERWAMSVKDGKPFQVSDDRCIQVIDPTSETVEGEADFVAFVPGGVRIRWNVSPKTRHQLLVPLYAGDDVSAKAETFLPGVADALAAEVITWRRKKK